MGSGVLNLLGSNLKVHFAGSDGDWFADCALRAANVNYRLYSCYPYICVKSVDSDFKLQGNSSIRSYNQWFRHTIQDSGLFTLMFGAGKGSTINMSKMIEWQDKLMNFVRQNNLSCTCVEMDVQKVLGVQQAWELRYRMKKMLKNRQINVFHFEDGKDGLDRLIDFAEYIAISVPELRIVKPKTFRKDVHNLAYYIKNKKPEIDIHLLGCTDFKMLKENSFCTSADSTSWLSGARYGDFSDGKQKGHISSFKPEILKNRELKMMSIINKEKISVNRKINTLVSESICATICKQRYTEMAGSQE